MADQREIEVSVMVHRETDSAWQVSDTGELKDAVWIPKSQVDDGGDVKCGSVCEMLIPEWLATAKGLI